MRGRPLINQLTGLGTALLLLTLSFMSHCYCCFHSLCTGLKVAEVLSLLFVWHSWCAEAQSTCGTFANNPICSSLVLEKNECSEGCCKVIACMYICKMWHCVYIWWNMSKNMYVCGKCTCLHESTVLYCVHSPSVHLLDLHSLVPRQPFVFNDFLMRLWVASKINEFLCALLWRRSDTLWWKRTNKCYLQLRN